MIAGGSPASRAVGLHDEHATELGATALLRGDRLGEIRRTDPRHSRSAGAPGGIERAKRVIIEPWSAVRMLRSLFSTAQSPKEKRLRTGAPPEAAAAGRLRASGGRDWARRQSEPELSVTAFSARLFGDGDRATAQAG